MTELEIAEQIARAAHAGQKEKLTGEDCIRHVERVVGLVETDKEKAVAWLHDVLEDTPVSVLELRAAGISLGVRASVAVVSHVPWETYAEYIIRIRDSGNAAALAVKLADLRDHFRSSCPQTLRTRYEKAWEVLTHDALPPAP